MSKVMKQLTISQILFCIFGAFAVCGGGSKATAAEPKSDPDEPARLCLQRATAVIVGVSDGLPLESSPPQGSIVVKQVLKGKLKVNSKIRVYGVRWEDNTLKAKYNSGTGKHYHAGKPAIFLLDSDLGALGIRQNLFGKYRMICFWPDPTNLAQVKRVEELLERNKTGKTLVGATQGQRLVIQSADHIVTGYPEPEWAGKGWIAITAGVALKIKDHLKKRPLEITAKPGGKKKTHNYFIKVDALEKPSERIRQLLALKRTDTEGLYKVIPWGTDGPPKYIDLVLEELARVHKDAESKTLFSAPQ